MNWVSITSDDLKAVAPGGLVDASATPGQPDPVAAAIADAVATVRRAVSTGNVLDTDPATVPGSLRGLAARTAVFALLERAELALTADQRTTRAADAETLRRIGEERLGVEPADHPASGGMGIVETVAPGNCGQGREELRGI